MGVATTRPSYGLGPPNPTKKFVHQVDLLGHPLSRNHVFEIFRAIHKRRPHNLANFSTPPCLHASALPDLFEYKAKNLFYIL